MKWLEQREMKVNSDLTDQSMKSTLSSYHLFLMKFSRNLTSGLLDQLIFLREEDLPFLDGQPIRHHPTKSREELEALNQQETQAFFELWTNQDRTPQQISDLITHQFQLASQLFTDVRDYHLRAYNELLSKADDSENAPSIQSTPSGSESH